jgi:hypothetical protein
LDLSLTGGNISDVFLSNHLQLLWLDGRLQGQQLFSIQNTIVEGRQTQAFFGIGTQ